MKKLAISVGLLLSVSFTLAHADENATMNILNMYSSGPNKIDMIVSVLDESGVPIRDLGTANFKVLVEGKEITNFIVKPVSSPKSPLSVVLSMDVSGSMKGRPIAEAKKAAKIFLDQLDKEDFAALVEFGSKVNLAADFTSKEKIHDLRDKIDGLVANQQWTWLYQATNDSIEKAFKAPTSRVAVVLLTDGKDEGSPRTEESVLARIKGVQVPVYTLGFGGDAQVTYLKKVAAASGGTFLYTPAAEELTNLYKLVMEQIKNQYLIEFGFDNPAGMYTSTLVFTYRGREISSQRRFLHSLAEPAISAKTPTPVVQVTPPPATPPGSDMLVWGILIVLIVGGLGAGGYFFLRPKLGTLVKEPVGPSPLSRMEGGQIHPIVPPGSQSGVSRTTVILQSPGEVGLEVHAGPVPVHFPLMDTKNNKNYEEVILTRFDQEVKGFFDNDKTYLLLADKTVSRPNETRPGHARIFFDPETKRYKIEDLGSAGGTKLNETAIEGEVALENRDNIIIGGVNLMFYDKRVTTETHY